MVFIIGTDYRALTKCLRSYYIKKICFIKTKQIENSAQMGALASHIIYDKLVIIINEEEFIRLAHIR